MIFTDPPSEEAQKEFDAMMAEYARYEAMSDEELQVEKEKLDLSGKIIDASINEWRYPQTHAPKEIH